MLRLCWNQRVVARRSHSPTQNSHPPRPPVKGSQRSGSSAQYKGQTHNSANPHRAATAYKAMTSHLATMLATHSSGPKASHWPEAAIKSHMQCCCCCRRCCARPALTTQKAPGHLPTRCTSGNAPSSSTWTAVPQLPAGWCSGPLHHRRGVCVCEREAAAGRPAPSRPSSLATSRSYCNCTQEPA